MSCVIVAVIPSSFVAVLAEKAGSVEFTVDSKMSTATAILFLVAFQLLLKFMWLWSSVSRLCTLCSAVEENYAKNPEGAYTKDIARRLLSLLCFAQLFPTTQWEYQLAHAAVLMQLRFSSLAMKRLLLRHLKEMFPTACEISASEAHVAIRNRK